MLDLDSNPHAAVVAQTWWVFMLMGKDKYFFNLMLEDTEEESNKYGSAWCLLTCQQCKNL